MRAIVCAVVATVALAVQPACAADAFWKTVQATCNAAAAKPSALGQRIAQTAIDEFTRFGGHRIDADGRLFRFGLTEAEHEEDDGGAGQSRLDRLGWWQVMKYWYSLFGSETTTDKLEVRGYRDASTSTQDSQMAELLRSNAARLMQLADSVSDPAEREMLREAALRAAIVDTSWSAAFISYVVRQSGVTGDRFRFANAHAVYIYDAFAASRAEVGNDANDRLYRACPLTTTKPRPGDLICNQREPAFADASEAAVRERVRADLAGAGSAGASVAGAAGGGATPTRSIRRTHCEVVAYVDARARKLYTIGGNVNQAVAARKQNLQRDLTFSPSQKGRCGGTGHWTMPQGATPQASADTPKAANGASHAPSHTPKCSLNDKKWFVLLQVR